MAEIDVTQDLPDGEKLRKDGETWMERITDAEKREGEFMRHAEMAEKAYTANEKTPFGKIYDFNILHSNVETIVPSVYNSTPSPDIRRRFNDKDPGAKQYADMLERAISVQIDDNRLDKEMERVARDGELAGRGLIRIRFEADEVEEQIEQPGEVEFPEEMSHNPILANERITFEAVSWRDFRMGKAKRWEDVPWVAFKHSVDRDEIERRTNVNIFRSQFGEAEKPLLADEENDILIWEVWSKEDRKVTFVRDSDGAILDRQDDPLELAEFFPVPEPIQPLTITGKMTPVVPFKVYEKLADELDHATKRINKIMHGLKVRGLLAGVATDVKNLSEADDNELIIAEQLEQLAALGGLERAITWWPVEQAIAVLQQLYVQREQTKQAIFEITGVSDIVRGASKASETLGAQQIKTQFGSLRLSRRQGMAQRHVRDIFVIMAQIITTRFSGQRLQEMTGIQITPEVEAMFANPVLASYRVDVESDSTIRADMTKQKGEMSEFLAGTGQYFATMAPLVAQSPAMGQPVAEIYASFARHFSLGKQAEDALETLTQMAQQAAEQQQGQKQQQPDPEQIKAQLEGRQMQLQGQIDQQKAQADMALKQLDLQIKQVDLQIRQAEAQGKGIDVQSKTALANLKLEQTVLDAQNRQETSL